jgi:cell pole-organizing protein PopZ
MVCVCVCARARAAEGRAEQARLKAAADREQVTYCARVCARSDASQAKIAQKTKSLEERLAEVGCRVVS